MKRMMMLSVLVLLLGCVLGFAIAEETPVPTPTSVPAVLAQPDATPKPYATPTPRPTEAPLPEDVFFANVVEIARRIDLLAESRRFMQYVNGYMTSDDVLSAVTRGDHTNPIRCWQVDGLELARALTANGAQAALPLDLSRQEILQVMVDSLPQLMLVDRTSEELSLISVLSRYKAFACEGVEGCGLLILQYEDATPVAVSWYETAGAVKASAQFLPDPDLEACETAEAVSAWFAGLGLPPVAFEEVVIP